MREINGKIGARNDEEYSRYTYSRPSFTLSSYFERKGKERKGKEKKRKGRMRVGRCLSSIFHLLGASFALTIPETIHLISSNSTRLSSVSHPYQLG